MLLTQLLIAGAVMAVLGISLSTVLAIANKKLHVHEDPRIEQVEEMLPQVNCGACGTAGCGAFAEAVVSGKMSPADCPVNSPEMVAAIAAFLGVEAGSREKSVARLACAGGSNVARVRALYKGVESCRAAALVAGGGKECPWGCLGLGDCAVVCPFDAIVMNDNDLPVVDEEKCTGCGACVDICPKNLFELLPISKRLWVACKSQIAGADAEAQCAVACTACGRCVMDAPDELIAIKHGLAVIDHSKQYLASRKIIERCPTGAIVWCDKDKGLVRGSQAKKITRKSPLPIR